MRRLIATLVFVAAMLAAQPAAFGEAKPAAAKSAPANPASKVPSADGVPIAYEVHGQGSVALVLVHGWSCDRSYWQEQIQDLSPQYQLVLVDLAGHGDSGLGRKNYTMEAFGDDVAAVVEKLDLKNVVLVGHSMGGDVIVEAARKLKGRVTGMVMVDTYKTLGQPSDDAQVQAFIGKFRKDFRGTTTAFVRGLFGPNADPKLVDRISRDMAAAPPAVALSALENSFSHESAAEAALLELKLPVRAINSDNAPTDHESLAKYGVKAYVLPDVGHFLQLEDPPRFNRSLDSVVKGLVQ
jgi:pimeloyl-ACP methyl ester carboxylesterase